ncbi:hypothetical protein MIR68_004859 [Amoeboaphelidium protococcarum]|nr:hypothetical protein MIR68_004859 [Amoeboaphelidium protococcarum]
MDDLDSLKKVYTTYAGDAPVITAQQAYPVLQQSGLPQDVLIKIWNSVDVMLKKQLDFNGFVQVMKAVKAQQMQQRSPGQTSQQFIPVQKTGSSVNSYYQPSITDGSLSMGMSNQQQSQSNVGPFQLSDADLQQFTTVFKSIDTMQSGSISNQECAQCYMKSNLGQDILSQVWKLLTTSSLVPTTPGRISKAQFIIGMSLIKSVLQGSTLPQQIPQSLVMKVTSSGQQQSSMMSHQSNTSPSYNQSYTSMHTSPSQGISNLSNQFGAAGDMDSKRQSIFSVPHQPIQPQMTGGSMYGGNYNSSTLDRNMQNSQAMAQSVERLQKNVQQRTDEIASLQNNSQMLNNEVAELQAKQQKLQQDLGGLDSQKKELEQKVMLIKQQRDQEVNNVREMSSKFAATQQQIEELSRRISQESGELEQIQQKSIEGRQWIEKQNQDLQMLNQQYQSIQHEKEALLLQFNADRTQAMRLVEEKQQTEQSIAQIQQQIASIQLERQHQQSEIQNLSNNMDNLRNQKSQLEQNLKDMQNANQPEFTSLNWDNRSVKSVKTEPTAQTSLFTSPVTDSGTRRLSSTSVQLQLSQKNDTTKSAVAEQDFFSDLGFGSTQPMPVKQQQQAAKQAVIASSSGTSNYDSPSDAFDDDFFKAAATSPQEQQKAVLDQQLEKQLASTQVASSPDNVQQPVKSGELSSFDKKFPSIDDFEKDFAKKHESEHAKESQTVDQQQQQQQKEPNPFDEFEKEFASLGQDGGAGVVVQSDQDDFEADSSPFAQVLQQSSPQKQMDDGLDFFGVVSQPQQPASTATQQQSPSNSKKPATDSSSPDPFGDDFFSQAAENPFVSPTASTKVPAPASNFDQTDDFNSLFTANNLADNPFSSSNAAASITSSPSVKNPTDKVSNVVSAQSQPSAEIIADTSFFDAVANDESGDRDAGDKAVDSESSPDASKVQEVTSMGFSEEQATTALAAANGNVQQALNILLDQGSAPAEDTADQAQKQQSSHQRQGSQMSSKSSKKGESKSGSGKKKGLFGLLKSTN